MSSISGNCVRCQQIEALQAENEQLRTAQVTHYCVNCEGMARENEQLKAQNAELKKVLELCSWYGGEGLCIDEKLAYKIVQVLKPDASKAPNNAD
jgi:hypothetical protein